MPLHFEKNLLWHSLSPIKIALRFFGLSKCKWNVAGLNGPVVHTTVEITRWRPVSGRLWRSFQKDQQLGARFLRDHVERTLLAQVSNLRKNLKFTFTPFRTFCLWSLGGNHQLHWRMWQRWKTVRAKIVHADDSGQNVQQPPCQRNPETRRCQL